MHRKVLAGWLLLVGVLTGSATSAAPAAAEVEALAAEAYVFGYPLVLMDISRQVMTAVAKPETSRAPVNQFNDSQEFPDPSFTSVVSPNADTLYSMSWIDLSKGPIVLSLPNTGDRYYLMQMMDAWTNVFAAPGTRTTGNQAGDYAIVGPGWSGDLPNGMHMIQSPTDMVWMIGRTQTNGPQDYAAVRALKKKYQLIPLSAWGKPYTPPADVPVDPSVDLKTPPVEQVARLNATEFFTRLARLMVGNPPAPADGPMVEKLARLGVVAGKPFMPADLAAIERGAKLGLGKLLAEGKTLGGAKKVNGWSISLDVGKYGTDYPHRAVIALVGLGANLPDDAVYPMTGIDADGQALSGANKYVLVFPPGELPPVKAFWSLTMYNAQRFFVSNPIERYAIGDRDALKLGEDGSLTLYLQQESPGAAHVSNWLPAPAGPFNLILRLYWPKPEVLHGKWVPPGVKRVP